MMHTVPGEHKFFDMEIDKEHSENNSTNIVQLAWNGHLILKAGFDLFALNMVMVALNQQKECYKVISFAIQDAIAHFLICLLQLSNIFVHEECLNASKPPAPELIIHVILPYGKC